MYKNVAEIEAALAEKYSGPIFQREGAGGRTFDYIPWTETVRLLNKVFGAGHWETSQPTIIFADGVYTVSLLLIVEADTEEGQAFVKSVPGIGQAVSRGANDDNAAKSALSDAISRAAKLLGDAFGFFLYEKRGSAPATRSATPTGNSAGKGPSDKQRKILTGKLGYTDESLATAPYAQWKADLDGYFEGLKNQEASVF